MDDFMKEIDKMIQKTAKAVEEGSKDLVGTLDKERKKMEIKAQIGHHDRAISKAYERIGEAYYNHMEDGDSLESIKDVLDLVRSNRKVIELLNSQLDDLEKK